MGVGYGKVILLGEHAVVHGYPALAAALSRGCTAHASAEATTSLSVLPWGVRVERASEPQDRAQSQLRQAFDALCQALQLDAELAVEAQMAIPSGAGLGGSAALSVAVARALDEARGIERSTQELIEASLCWERVFHGTPSGVDSAMATAGGVALFRKGQPLEPLTVARPLWLVVGHSGVSASTKETVASVARQYEQDRARVSKVFEGIEAVVVNGRRALAEGSLEHLGQLMDLNQRLLNSLLLSTARLEELCNAARAAGALGAKLTGGGGGGCMIALGRDEAAAHGIQQALSALGSEAFVLEAGR